ncbi:L-asparaginase II [Aspergillus unguis]
MTIESTDYVASFRSGIIENRHQVHAAVTDSAGKVLFSIGDPHRLTLIRSAAKPAQALAILESGCFEKFPELSDADLALMCASHNSEERHVERARNMLRIVEASEKDLKCGGHASISESVNREWIRKDFVPTAVWNNCSGKHAGMLGGCRALGAEVQGYHLPEHPVQVKVRKVVEELSGLGDDADLLKWGVDGCNLPAPAMPLQCLSKMYAVVGAAADTVEESESLSFPVPLSTRTQALSRIFHAMSQYPEFVGGEGRFCTDIMQGFQGAVIGKVGADGCYSVGIRASEQTRMLGAAGAIGIAVKIEDGNLGVLYSVVAEIIDRLKIGSPEMRGKLEAFHHPEIKNTAGVVTGGYSHLFDLRRVD